MGKEASQGESGQQSASESGGSTAVAGVTLQGLLQSQLAVINVGLEGFAEELAAESVPVTQLDWRPPAEGDAQLARLLSKLGS